MRDLKSSFLNLLLVFASVGVTYLILEFIVFAPHLHYVPLKFHGDLPHGIRSLAQGSKKSLIPRDYIALVGDSYAQGYGEWLLSVNPYTNPPYHSAHFLHSKLNVDVITFGAGGAGSLRGLVSEPIAQWKYVNSTAFYFLDQPSEILVYFYSGNDLNDNLKDLALRFFNRYPMRHIQDTDEFRKFITDVVLSDNNTYIQAKHPSWYQNLFFAQTIGNILARWPGLLPTQTVSKRVRAPEPELINWAQIGSELVPLPNELQSPSLDLTAEELNLGSYVFEQAVLYLKNFFSRSKIRIIYVPSTLESYGIASVEVDIQSLENRARRFPSTFLARRSLTLRGLIRSVAQKHGLVFVDSTPFIRNASEHGFVHGPKEWRHFNRKGYEALSHAAIYALSTESHGPRKP